MSVAYTLTPMYPFIRTLDRNKENNNYNNNCCNKLLCNVKSFLSFTNDVHLNFCKCWLSPCSDDRCHDRELHPPGHRQSTVSLLWTQVNKSSTLAWTLFDIHFCLVLFVCEKHYRTQIFSKTYIYKSIPSADAGKTKWRIPPQT